MSRFSAEKNCIIYILIVYIFTYAINGKSLGRLNVYITPNSRSWKKDYLRLGMWLWGRTLAMRPEV